MYTTVKLVSLVDPKKSNKHGTRKVVVSGSTTTDLLDIKVVVICRWLYYRTKDQSL